MLWALLISLILRKQLRGAKSATTLSHTLDYTPGFYELETKRLEKYADAMRNKFNSAIAKQNKTREILTNAAANKKSANIQYRAFMRNCASGNNVMRASDKYINAQQDLAATRAIAEPANTAINMMYDLAYASKMEILKYRLSNFSNSK